MIQKPDIENNPLASGHRHGGATYRPDIDGLRALAVLAVLAFHYYPGKLPGGFIGVDIFFVISGFLITGIIAREFGEQRFSIRTFYQHRIRRIFPALVLVLAFSLVAGWFLLFPSEYRILGKHVAAGAGFIENFVLWSEAGYFDSSALGKPLLHLWSLAIEEQYYLLWPLVLWLVLRQRWSSMAAVAAIALASFAVNLWDVAQGDITAAFYSPVSRAWELMAGSWLALTAQRNLPYRTPNRNLQAWLGLFLLIGGFAIVRSDHFPGAWALLPVLGSLLVINAGVSATPNRILLAWRPVVWIGLISYPLYLWHWVLWSLFNVVFDKSLFGMEQLRAIKVAFIAISIGLSWLTYLYVEKPVREAGNASTTLPLAILVSLIGIAGLHVMHLEGFQSRSTTLYNAQYQELEASISRPDIPENCFNRRKGGNFDQDWICHMGSDTARRKIFVYGDSHALHALPAFEELARKADMEILFNGEYDCLVAAGTYTFSRNSKRAEACHALARNNAIHALRNKVDLVIVIQRWTNYDLPGAPQEREHHNVGLPDKDGRPIRMDGITTIREGLSRDMSTYLKNDIPVILVEDNPQQAGDYKKLRLDAEGTDRFHFAGVDQIQKRSVTYESHKDYQSVANGLLEEIAAKFPNVSLLDTDKAFCGKKLCPLIFKGMSLYYNDDHISKFGASRLYPLLVEKVNEILKLDLPVPALEPIDVTTH